MFLLIIYISKHLVFNLYFTWNFNNKVVDEFFLRMLIEVSRCTEIETLDNYFHSLSIYKDNCFLKKNRRQNKLQSSFRLLLTCLIYNRHFSSKVLLNKCALSCVNLIYVTFKLIRNKRLKVYLRHLEAFIHICVM